MRFVFEESFNNDYRRLKKSHPAVIREFEELLPVIVEMGDVPASYGPHLLDKPGGNYTGCMEFHLSEGRYDVVVIYVPHRTNPSIRFVRIGSHQDLFQGPLL